MKREQTTSCCIFACFLVLALKSPLLAAFAVQFLLAVSLCQLGRMEGGNSPKFGSAWHQLRTLRKNLGS